MSRDASSTTGVGCKSLLLGVILTLLPWQACVADPVASDPVAQARALAESDRPAAIEALTALWQQPQHPQRIEAGLALVRQLNTARRHQNAAATAAEIAALPDLSDDDLATVTTHHLDALSYLRDLSNAAELSERATGLLERDLPAQRRVELMHALARLHLRQGRFKEVEHLGLEALDVLEDTASEMRFISQQMVGVALAQQGRFADAVEAMQTAERIARRMGKKDDPQFLSNLGGLFIYLEDWPRAVEYLTRAVRALEEGDFPTFNRASIYNNLGAAHQGAGQLDEARHWFEKSLQAAQERGTSTSSALNNLATLLRDQGRDAEALALFEEVLQLASAEKERPTAGVAEKNIGETLVKLGRRERAAEHLERALRIHTELDLRPKLLELYPVLIDNLEALGRSAEALRQMRAFKALSDEVSSVESRERIASLEATVELAQKEGELAASERDRALQQVAIQDLQSERERQRLLRHALLAGVVVLALLALLLWRTLHYRTRAHRVLAEKSSQISRQHEELRRLNSAVHRQARQDSLTGLHNRLFFREFTEVGDNVCGGVLILADLDSFKRINDSFGHAAGDEVLRAFAEVLRESARDRDLLVRWGGEEFIWICPETPPNAAPSLCERIRDRLAARKLEIDGKPVSISASFGFAGVPLWPGQSPDWALALRIADHALYQSKAAGRDRWTGYAGRGDPPDPERLKDLSVDELVGSGALERIENA